MHVIMFSKTIECITVYINLYVNYGLKLIILYQYWLTDCNQRYRTNARC